MSDILDRDGKKLSRRDFLKTTGLIVGGATMAGATPAWLRSAAWAAGSEGIEKTDVTFGIIPLTDCAPIVVAYEKGYFKKYGLNVNV